MSGIISCVCHAIKTQGNSISFQLKEAENKGMTIQHLKEIPGVVKDPRRVYGNLRHKPENIIITGRLSMLCPGEDFVDMEAFGEEREDWLRGFPELPGWETVVFGQK